MSVTTSSVSRMSTELWLYILDHFVLSGAPTTTDIQESKSELRPHVLENRRTLWAACLVSRQISAVARDRLYKAVLINDCHGLLYLFRTLRTVPKLRILVRSFFWTGTLPQSDSDDTECVDLMPSLGAVFAALPPPVTDEDALFHRFLNADNLAQLRAWQLLAVILAIMPKLTTLFLVIGHLLPPPRMQQVYIDEELDGGGTAEERADLILFRQETFELIAIRALITEDEMIPTTLGRPILPELQLFMLDHTSDTTPFVGACRGEDVVDGLLRLCPQLRYIQTKGSLHFLRLSEPAPSTSMKSLLVRRVIFPTSDFPTLVEMQPNLASLRIVLLDGDEHHNPDSWGRSFEELTKLRQLRYLSLTTPHDISWSGSHSHPIMPPFLRRMGSLQHLRVDFIWLAAINDPSPLLHLASFLPSSIKSLHLLDYWGVDMTSTRRDKYPEFPDGILPLEFMHQVLENLLQNSASMGLTSLRHVRLSSLECTRDRLHWTTIRISHHSLMRRFQEARICLEMTGLEEAREEEDGWWLNLD